jgi:hypothetical protein
LPLFLGAYPGPDSVAQSLDWGCLAREIYRLREFFGEELLGKLNKEIRSALWLAHLHPRVMELCCERFLVSAAFALSYRILQGLEGVRDGSGSLVRHGVGSGNGIGEAGEFPSDRRHFVKAKGFTVVAWTTVHLFL